MQFEFITKAWNNVRIDIASASKPTYPQIGENENKPSIVTPYYWPIKTYDEKAVKNF